MSGKEFQVDGPATVKEHPQNWGFDAGTTFEWSTGNEREKRQDNEMHEHIQVHD